MPILSLVMSIHLNEVTDANPVFGDVNPLKEKGQMPILPLVMTILGFVLKFCSLKKQMERDKGTSSRLAAPFLPGSLSKN